MDNNQYWTVIQKEWNLDAFKSAIEDYLNSFSSYCNDEKIIRLTDDQISRINDVFECEFGTADLSYVNGIEQDNLNDFINGLASEFYYE